MTPKRLYETKGQRAKRLLVGTWFVWPDALPKRNQYYQPRVYQVLDEHKISKPVYADLGMWTHQHGVNSPQAAYDRANENAKYFNAVHADYEAASAYVERQQRERSRNATETLSAMLTSRRDDRKP